MKKKEKELDECLRKLKAIEECMNAPPILLTDKRYIKLKGGDRKCQILDNIQKRKF